MKHLTKKQILELTAGGLTTPRKLWYILHLLFCKSCREQVVQEKQFAERTSKRLKKITSHAHPSAHMDNRVRAVIGELARSVVVKAPIMARWIFTTILVFVIVASSYGTFFFVPVVGAAHETPAEAYVSSKFTSVMAKSAEVIPDPSDFLKSNSFLTVWCDRLMVCASEYTKLVYLEGHSIDDVFRASILADSAGVSTESVLPLVKSGKTWGQILSELDITFIRQLNLPSDVSKTLIATANEIENVTTVETKVVKHEDGHVSSPVPLTREIKEYLAVGQSDVEVDLRTGKPTGNVEKSAIPSLYTGVITKIGEGNSSFILETATDSFTVRITWDTNVLRYDEYMLPSQLMVGHICTVDGIWLNRELVATFLDAKEPTREISTDGIVLDMDTETLTVAGFGSALYLTENTKLTGKLEVGSKVTFVATGNEIEGFEITTLNSAPKPEPVLTPAAPKAEFTGVVVGVDKTEKLILLADGSSIFYNSKTEFEVGMTPSVGQSITSTALSSNTLPDEMYQDQAITIKINSHPDLTDKFEVAGTFTGHKCLNGCNWLKPEGVTEVELANHKTQKYLIIPSTDGHSLISPSYKGMTVILEGFVADGVNIVTRVNIVDPREIQTRSGIVTEISENKTTATLDDGTVISIRAYTENSDTLELNKKFQFTCWQETTGKLTALTLVVLEDKKIIQTDWLVVVAFDGEKLELSDGTVIFVVKNTRVQDATLSGELESSSIKVGLKVLVDYTKDGDKNTATLIKVFVNP